MPLVLAGVAVAVLLGGCGGDQDGFRDRALLEASVEDRVAFAPARYGLFNGARIANVDCVDVPDAERTFQCAIQGSGGQRRWKTDQNRTTVFVVVSSDGEAWDFIPGT